MHRSTTRRLAVAGSLVSALAVTVAASPSIAAPRSAPAIVNPSFESGLDGWSVAGPAGAAKTEAGGADGSATRLTHWLADAGQVTTSQHVAAARPGWQTFTVDVKSGGDPGTSQIRTVGCRRNGTTTVPATLADDAWVQIAVSADLGPRGCTLVLRTAGPSGSWASFDDVRQSSGVVADRFRGADLSSLAANEAHGAVYKDRFGRRVDPVRYLAAEGANLGRLRVWVNSANGTSSTSQVIATARRMRDAGMKVLIDFHYSDTWTDPGHQSVPAAWAGLSASDMAQRLHDYTVQVMTALRRAGITPWGVQVGNEINSGMLWPLGQTWDVDPTDGVTGAQWDNLAMFLKAGATAVKEVSPHTKVLLHLTNINNGIGGLTWWLDNITSEGVPFDIIGLSYYSYWHGSLADLQNAVSTLSARYDRDVLVVETSYPWTLTDDPTNPYPNTIDSASELTPGYPATPEGQAANFRAVEDAVAAAPGGRGLGAVYWEPTWTAVAGAGWDPTDPTSGDGWDNQAIFDHDGRALPAVRDFTPVDRP